MQKGYNNNHWKKSGNIVIHQLAVSEGKSWRLLSVTLRTQVSHCRFSFCDPQLRSGYQVFVG